MPEQEISFDQLPPEARTAFSSTPAPEQEVDPLSLDTATLFDLTKAKAFDPIQYGLANPGRATDVDAAAKLSDVHALSRERGFQPEDLPSAGQAVKAVGHAGLGIVKQLFNYAQIAAEPIQSLAGYLTGQDIEFQTELTKLNERRAVETAAGTEAAISGLATLPGKAIGKAVHAAGKFAGLAKPYDQQTAEEKSKAFFDALGQAQTAAEISQGKGGLVGNIAGETVKELEAAGTPVRPEEVEMLAAGDPLSFILFGKAFNVAGNLAAKAVPQSVKVLAGKAFTAAEPLAVAPEVIGGRLLQGAGKVIEATGKGAKAIVTAPGTGAGAVGGALAAGNPGVALGIAVTKPAFKFGAGVLQSVGEKVASLGKRVATQEGFTPYVQVARDVFAAAPIIATGALKGAAFDLGLAAATAETPAETDAASAFGTVLGGLHGVGRAGMRAVQGQIVTPRAWGTAVQTPAYGSFPALDILNSSAQRSRAPGEVLRSNAVRQFLKGAGDKAQAYLMPDAASMEKALTDLGYSPADAKAAAAQQGMTVQNLTDASGKARRVIFLNSADVAPHEVFHGMQDVLGEQANTVIDGLVFQEYAPQWEKLGNQYADRLGKGSPGESWRDTVLDVSKWGDAAAAEKAIRDAGNRLRNETGAEPDPKAARDLAAGVLAKARESGAGWREILTPEEATQEANRYLARELAAENFDVAFKHLGGKLEGNSLPEKLARIVANTASFLGAEPLAGAPRSDVLGVEPKFSLVEGTAKLGKSLKVADVTPPLPKVSGAAPAPAATAPFSPAERAAAGEQAGTFADELIARNPQTGEVLRKIASAISGGQGIKVDYRAAPGEPGGSPNMSREARRAVIEAFREMPEDVRPLWEKLNFPDRVESTKNKGFQILGWSPENFAANAQKMAKFIADVQAKTPATTGGSPYEIDPATKSFTPDGWRSLYEDVQTFVKNQQAGGTGSGRPLQLPANAAEMRVNVPPLREAALTPLDQTKADFINVLFNIMLPETPRVSRAGGTPGNLVAQRIARANESVVGPRVVEPGRARSAAEFKGFPGERIQEVNPLRARMEQAATDAGVSFPALIETSQRLNLDHIADVTPAPEAPVIRGVTDTLRAGFAPAEKAVENRGREILAMSPEEFTRASREWAGGLTGEAQRLGLSVTTKEDVATLRRFADEAQAKVRQFMSEKKMEEAFAQVGVKQLFNEAVESATGTGGNGDALRAKLGDAYKPPVPEGAAPTAQFAPKTKAGKELEKKGYEFKVDDTFDSVTVNISRKGEPEMIAWIEAHNVEGSGGKKYVVENVVVPDELQNQGMGTTLYRELASRLQARGATALEGEVVHAAPIAIRKKLFGKLTEDEHGFVESKISPTKQFAPKPSEEVRDVAKKYAEEAGIPYAPAQKYRALNPELGKRLADFYDSAKSNPTDPEVKASYRALADETMRQWEVMKDAGYKIEPWDGKGEPYKTSADAIADVRDNKHLYFLKTEEQFGKGEELNQENALLTDSGISINGQRLLVNDVFRAVHDFFGHAKEGFEFGPRGEFNAWAVHSELYSPEAQGALAAETLAQNSWVNFGKHLRNKEGNVPAKGEPGYKSPTERPFGEQKNVIVPQELIDEARGQFAPKKAKDEAKLLPADASGMSKAWILPSGKIEQLGGQWHHAWLDENPEVAQKYKLTVPKFEGNDSGTVREDALKKGFVRVNYGRNTGTLTVEARKKDWRHQKAAVEKLVEKNLDDIDNMTVHLLDETATKVVDSDSERLFRHDEDVDKMSNLPFITKEGGDVRGAQFSPAAETTLSSEEFGKELSKIRAGQSGGQTFNSNGTVWTAPKEPVDVVTLASVNIPLGSAKPEAVKAALAQYEDLLNQPGIVAGVFAFSKDGKPTMSADINAVVPQEFRDNSFAFVKDNDQVSFWDAVKNEEVKTGGKGNTKLTTVDQLLTAQEALLKGEPIDVAALAGAGTGETQGLPGLEMGREFNQKAITQMSQAELRKHFPEALVPRDSAEEIPYDIVESPLFKAAGSREAAVKSFGRKLVEFYRENERSPELKAGEKWYSEFTPLLKKQFGKDAQIFAELLAATSPNTEPGVNFAFAFDALSNWKAGKYEKMIPKFNEGMERLADGSLKTIYERDEKAGKVKNPPAKASEATYLAHWILKHDLIPISSSGKRFGMHSEAVLKVLARRWLSQTTGPKTQNFVKNLVGTGHDATVDVWAARTMRRLGFSGSKERWRILPANSKGVSDVDFSFSQEAFREAAKEIGIKPDALQGALWFAEKKFWSDNGWGRLSLGDFRAEIEKVPALRKEFARKNLVEPKKKLAQMSLLDELVRKK